MKRAGLSLQEMRVKARSLRDDGDHESVSRLFDRRRTFSESGVVSRGGCS